MGEGAEVIEAGVDVAVTTLTELSIISLAHFLVTPKKCCLFWLTA